MHTSRSSFVPATKGSFPTSISSTTYLSTTGRTRFLFLRRCGSGGDRQFDLAVLFQNAFEAALIPFLAGVPLRLGYATESRQALLTHPLPLPDWRSSRHEVFYYLYLITALEQMLFGRSTVCEAEPDASIQISETRKAEAAELLRAVWCERRRHR